MMIKIEIELADSTAQAAGLLTPQALGRLFESTLRRQKAAANLLMVADEVAAAGILPITMDEINAELKAARAERRSR